MAEFIWAVMEELSISCCINTAWPMHAPWAGSGPGKLSWFVFSGAASSFDQDGQLYVGCIESMLGHNDLSGSIWIICLWINALILLNFSFLLYIFIRPSLPFLSFFEKRGELTNEMDHGCSRGLELRKGRVIQQTKWAGEALIWPSMCPKRTAVVRVRPKKIKARVN